MNDQQKVTIMQDTIKPIIDLLNQRMKSRQAVLNTLAIQPLDSNVPESIKKMREEEASKLRAVIQEQEDLLDTIKALYPNVQGT